MAYARAHILLRFNGHFGTVGSQLDKWSSGMRFGFVSTDAVMDTPKLITFANAASTAAVAFHTTTNVAAGTSAFLDNVSAARIGVNGKYDPAGQLTVITAPTVTAGIGSPTQPWNTAGVLSLRTALPRGRGSNGRVYWPYLAAVLNAGTGRLNTQLRVTAAKAFLDSLNTAANAYDPGMRLIVASNVGAGLNVPVIGVRSDDRLDSIERRENDQPSTWYSATLA